MYKPGTIFKWRGAFDKKDTIYKIVRIRDGYVGRGVLVYEVIKCTSTGKEFKYTTGLVTTAVDKLPPEAFIFIAEDIQPERVKVDPEQVGIKEGKRKRRIQYLEARILSDQKELERLKTMGVE